MKALKSFLGDVMGLGLFLMAAMLLLTATPSQAGPTPIWGTTDAGFFSYFGFTQDWAIIEVGTNSVMVTNQSMIDGNFGIAGSTSLTISNQSKVNHLFLNSNAHITESVTNGSTVGSTTHTNLNADVTATTNAANYFKGLPNSAASTWSSSNSSLSNKLDSGTTNGLLSLTNNQSLTLTAKSTTPVVFNISTFNLTNQSTLTLSGSANDEFVFNIYGGTLTVQNQSYIKLTGGLTPSDVIFDYVGSGGSGPSITNQSTLHGIVLASQQKVSISNQSQVIGAVISNGLNLTNQSSLPAIESADN